MTEYQYNALNQLTEVLNRTSTGGVLSRHTYTYNGQDLRASEIFDGSAIPSAPAVPDTTTTYTPNDVNQLLSTLGPDRAFVYDDDGNLTQGYTKDGYQFTATYDAENRLTSIQYTGSGSMLHRQEFRYSGDDVLAEQKRYENGVLVETVRIVRDGMLAIQDRNASNATVREYTWGLNLGGGIGGLLNLKTAGQNYAYLYDGKGNVEAVLNASQQVVAAYRYDPFGVLLAKTGTFEQPYGFSTKRYNAPVGMVQYEFRNYWPEIGLWDRRDPLGEAGGLNLYAFVGNNPVNWVDPWGLADCSFTEPVIQVFAIGLFDAFTVSQLVDESLAEAGTSGLPGLWNGPADAFRHCFWNCRMTEEIGAKNAEESSDLHEACDTTQQTPGEIAMDLHNNMMGIAVGRSGADCRITCLNLVNTMLQTSPNGTPPSDIY